MRIPVLGRLRTSPPPGALGPPKRLANTANPLGDSVQIWLVTIHYPHPLRRDIEMEAFSAGTLAGAGSFRCDSCGFAVALHERDPVPACPECGGDRFRRASLFGDDVRPPTAPRGRGSHRTGSTRRASALVRPGDYLAFEDDERVRVFPLQDGLDSDRAQPVGPHPLRRPDGVAPPRARLLRRRTAPASSTTAASTACSATATASSWRSSRTATRSTIGRFRVFFVSLVGQPRSR